MAAGLHLTLSEPALARGSRSWREEGRGIAQFWTEGWGVALGEAQVVLVSLPILLLGSREISELGISGSGEAPLFLPLLAQQV